MQVLCDGESAAQQEALALMSDLVHSDRHTRTAALQVRMLGQGGGINCSNRRPFVRTD
jgi:hypothetical protein